MAERQPGAGGATTRVLIGVLVAGNPSGLARLLAAIPEPSEPTIELDVVVIDNRPHADTRPLVERICHECHRDVSYIEEPEYGIPFARNACVRAALVRDVDALIFIDDDEWPTPEWLDALLSTWRATQADIVVGPAKGVLPPEAPRWARRSRTFDKDRGLADGASIRTAYSYNVLLSRRVLDTLGPAFDPSFRYTGSSDHHYFKQAAMAGFRSVWSPSALVYEEVGRNRTRLSWLAKRGYRTGAGAAVSARLRTGRLRAIPRITFLVGANLGYAGLHLIASGHPRFSWVESLRRVAIASGLVGANIWSYEEYRPRPPTA